jgi:hypothetical protein
MHEYPAAVRFWFYLIALLSLVALVAMLFVPAGNSRDLLVSAFVASIGTAGLSVAFFGVRYGFVLERAGRTVQRRHRPGYFWLYSLFWLTIGLLFGVVGWHGLLRLASGAG